MVWRWLARLWGSDREAGRSRADRTEILPSIDWGTIAAAYRTPARPSAPPPPPFRFSATVAARYRIGVEYRDAGGNVSRRVVSIAKIGSGDGGRPGSLECFCHLRGAARTFLVDRVQSFYDPETGEVLPAVNLTARPEAIGEGYLALVPKPQPPPKTLADLAEHREALAAAGWSTQIEDVPQGQLFGCHRTNARTGKLFRHPDVSLAFTPRVYHRRDGEAGYVFEFGGPKRKPWALRVRGGEEVLFADYEPAAEAFLAVALRGPGAAG